MVLCVGYRKLSGPVGPIQTSGLGVQVKWLYDCRANSVSIVIESKTIAHQSISPYSIVTFHFFENPSRPTAIIVGLYRHFVKNATLSKGRLSWSLCTIVTGQIQLFRQKAACYLVQSPFGPTATMSKSPLGPLVTTSKCHLPKRSLVRWSMLMVLTVTLALLSMTI